MYYIGIYLHAVEVLKCAREQKLLSLGEWILTERVGRKWD